MYAVVVVVIALDPSGVSSSEPYNHHDHHDHYHQLGEGMSPIPKILSAEFWFG
jgi:hypothetical protein